MATDQKQVVSLEDLEKYIEEALKYVAPIAGIKSDVQKAYEDLRLWVREKAFRIKDI